VYGTKQYEGRIQQFVNVIHGRRYLYPVDLQASYIYNQDAPIPYHEAQGATFTPIGTDDVWGRTWGSAWFRFEGTIPEAHRGEEVVALLDINGEGCVFVDGTPAQGITYHDHNGHAWAKRLYPVSAAAIPGQRVCILMEAGANDLFGETARVYKLKQAHLAVLDRRHWELYLDMVFLQDLMGALPQSSVRRRRILHGLNRVMNSWHGGAGIDECLATTHDILTASPAEASALTAWSTGHAHIDLAWMWPVRETIRKGGRTFATALKLMDEYPEYRFGQSQPQLYDWMKQRYPELYARIKQAVAAQRLECLGGMWVESDTNVPGGESLVRQFLYGKRFFREEFGVDVRNCWLPDVFGYSGALPQILRGCGIEYFVSQKLSWSDTNEFPHHTFRWTGIDGSEVLAHFLPANTYNCDNKPSELRGAQERFKEAHVVDSFLNLYGVGDGGGGPSRKHIEFARRARDCEGLPRVRFSFAQELLDHLGAMPREQLPIWKGELYLECHRATYTTQGQMKRDNRMLERRLHDVEFFGALSGQCPAPELERIWKATLLNQFHDVLPGSSIAWVYREAHEESTRNLESLDTIGRQALNALLPTHTGAEPPPAFAVWNTLSWGRAATVRLPLPAGGDFAAVDNLDREIPGARLGGELMVTVQTPSMGYTTVALKPGAPKLRLPDVGASTRRLENDLVRVEFAADGTIDRVFDKEAQREVVDGGANRLLLWEDDPHFCPAWDVFHYYLETTPGQARLTDCIGAWSTPFEAGLEQRSVIGASIITQRIVLHAGSKAVEFRTHVD